MTIIRYYHSPTGERATFVYEGGRTHAVRAYKGGVVAWVCDSVEEARQRWALLLADLVAGGFVPIVR